MKFRMKRKVLITGSGGFLGNQIIRNIIDLGIYRPLAFTSNKIRLKKKFKNEKNISYYDHEDWKNGKIPFSEIDTIINCAFARTSDGKDLANSLDFTNEFISDAVDNGVRGIINISSQSVYNQKRKFPATEESTVIPESLYGITKYSTEIIISNICKNKNVPYTNIRLASLVGIGFDVRLTTRFIKSAINDEPIRIVGGNQIISYLNVKDAADGIIALLSVNKNNWKPIYNLGVEDYYNIIEVANIVKKVAPQYISKIVKIEVENKDVSHNISMDCTQFYNDTGWKPKYNMEKIILEQFEYFRKNGF